MNVKYLRKYVMILLSILLIGCSGAKKVNFNKDLENMGYNEIVKIEENENKIILTKQDDSEFTQEEMDNIYEYVNSNYIKNKNYSTNISYGINYKQINIEITER